MTDEAGEPSTLLPPLPDRLVESRDKEAVILWLGAQEIPSRYRARWLREWGGYVGVAVAKADFDRVQNYP